jgi:hypothetical protein
MKKIVLTISLITICQCAVSTTTTNSLTINNYYAATCDAYTGTWQGYLTDPSDLFGNGGPWPVTVQLLAKNNQLSGNTSAIHYAQGNASISSRSIYAQCRHGKLTNIFWGELGQCGSLSQQGVLVSRNVLMLQLNYENSMTGATFTTFLTRQNNTYHGRLPSTTQYKPESVTSCH